MSRSTSAAFKAAVYAQQTDEIFLILLRLTLPTDPVSYLYLVNNTSDIVSNGQTYTAFPFSISLPTDENGRPSEATIAIDNVSRALVDELRGLTAPLGVRIQLIRASDPDVIEAEFDDFELRDVRYDAFSIQGRLTLESFISEPYPKDTLSAGNFAGLF